MGKNRLEAFSDGVIAIIITIMVLELKVPHGVLMADLTGLIPVFFSYVLSFIYVGIYWNNHHHMMHAAHKVNGRVLWANLHLLFWMSLIPFVTGWMGENHFAPIPTALYGAVLLMASVAYFFLTRALVASEGKHSLLATSIGGDRKGIASSFLYLAAIGLTFVDARLSMALYVLVAALWFIPDRRIERAIMPPKAV